MLQREAYITVPRSVVSIGFQKKTRHGFADANKVALYAAVSLACVEETGGVRQNLLVAKSRVAPRNLLIPKLELVAPHILARLVKHVKLAFQYHKFEELHLWSDSMLDG